MSQVTVSDPPSVNRQEIARDTAIGLTCSIIGMACTAGATILVAREAGAARFGLMAAILGVIAIGLDLSDLGTTQHLARQVALGKYPARGAMAAQKSRLVLMTTLILMLLCGLAALGVVPWGISIAALAYALGQATVLATVPVLRASDTQLMASTLVASDRVVLLAATCALWLIGTDPVMAYLLAGGISGVAMGVIWLHRAGLNSRQWVGAHELMAIVKKSRHFALVGISTDISNADVPLIKIVSDPITAGTFAIANRLSGLLGLPASVTAAVLAPRLAVSNTALSRHLLRITQVMLTLLFALLLGCALIVGPRITSALLGPSYGPDAVTTVQIATGAIAIGSLNQIKSCYLTARHGARVIARPLALLMVVGTVLIVAGSVIAGATGAATGLLIKELLVAIFLTQRVRGLQKSAT